MLQVGASALPANVPGVAAANPATQVPGAYGATSAAPYNLPSTSLPTLATAAAINVFANRIAGQAAAPLQARPAPAPLVPQGKKPGIGEARGSDAYKVAESRNFFASFPTSVTAVY